MESCHIPVWKQAGGRGKRALLEVDTQSFWFLGGVCCCLGGFFVLNCCWDSSVTILVSILCVGLGCWINIVVIAWVAGPPLGQLVFSLFLTFSIPSPSPRLLNWFITNAPSCLWMAQRAWLAGGVNTLVPPVKLLIDGFWINCSHLGMEGREKSLVGQLCGNICSVCGAGQGSEKAASLKDLLILLGTRGGEISNTWRLMVSNSILFHSSAWLCQVPALVL